MAEALAFITSAIPADPPFHCIADNYATQEHPTVKRWLDRPPRFHVHFIPTSASWTNMVERFSRDCTENRMRRGVFRSVPELIQALDEYVGRHNEAPKPYICTAKAQDILSKVMQAQATLKDRPSA